MTFQKYNNPAILWIKYIVRQTHALQKVMRTDTSFITAEIDVQNVTLRHQDETILVIQEFDAICWQASVCKIYWVCKRM